jgi:Family of unknown function (DUF5320)
MPRGDRTGPMGVGPMTGRAAGFCAGYSMPGNMNPVAGRGFGGRGSGGGGRGWRNWFHATGLPGWARVGMGLPAWGAGPYPYAAPVAPVTPPEAEVDALKAQAGYLEQMLQSLQQRIQKLESEAKAE